MLRGGAGGKAGRLFTSRGASGWPLLAAAC